MRALRERGAPVSALVRPSTAAPRIEALRRLGAVPVEAGDPAALAEACQGMACIVSALNGLEDTILDGQGHLLAAAERAGVPRFIPSDFSLDFFHTEPGQNRNLDWRRRFHERLDRSRVAGTSVLNGAFADMLTGQMPLIVRPASRVFYVGDPDQLLDFTTMDDTAAFTAEAALDPLTPTVLRIAGDVVSARGLAAAASDAYGKPFKPLRVGSLHRLRGVTRLLRRFGGEAQVFPAWQGMQYMHDMFSGAGKLAPLDNARYPGLRWTSVREVLARG